MIVIDEYWPRTIRGISTGLLEESAESLHLRVTRLVDRLVDRGWVGKARDGEARRLGRMKIVDESLDLLASLDDPVLAWLDGLLAPLDSNLQAATAPRDETAWSMRARVDLHSCISARGFRLS